MSLLLVLGRLESKGLPVVSVRVCESNGDDGSHRIRWSDRAAHGDGKPARREELAGQTGGPDRETEKDLVGPSRMRSIEMPENDSDPMRTATLCNVDHRTATVLIA